MNTTDEIDVLIELFRRRVEYLQNTISFIVTMAGIVITITIFSSIRGLSALQAVLMASAMLIIYIGIFFGIQARSILFLPLQRLSKIIELLYLIKVRSNEMSKRHKMKTDKIVKMLAYKNFDLKEIHKILKEIVDELY